MSKARIMGRKVVDNSTENDYSYQIHLRISLNAKERKEILGSRKYRNELVVDLRDRGFIENHGCDCSHCRRDYDCCGRMFVSWTRVVPVKRGVAVIQQYRQNV